MTQTKLATEEGEQRVPAAPVENRHDVESDDEHPEVSNYCNYYFYLTSAAGEIRLIKIW